MPIFECSACHAKMQASEEHAGKMTVCPDCGAKTRIPSEDGAIAAGPAASSAAAPDDAIAAPEHARAGKRRPRDDEDDRDMPRRDRSSAAAGAAAGMSAGVIVLIVLGVVGCVGLTVAGILAALLVPAVSKVREAAARTQASNNLKQIGLAIHAHHDANMRLPGPKHQQGAIGAKASDLSWRVSILPYVEQQPLYKSFDLNGAWNDPKNQQFLNRRPMVYGDPMFPDTDQTKTIYQYFTGPKTLFPDLERPTYKINTIPDGSSNTIMVAQANSAVPWSQPLDMKVDGGLPLPADRFLALMGDGSVRFVDRSKTSDQTLRLVIDPADGQFPLPADWDR